MNIFNLTPEQQAERNRLALRNLFIVVVFTIIVWSIGAYLTRDLHISSPTREQRAESWRQQKLESERAKNYVENIKPYIPKE